MNNAAWMPICKVDDIPVLGSRRVARERGIDVAVFRNDAGEVFALLDRCPHKGGPLSQGIVFGTSVACPLHNWTIGLCDGQASAPDEGCTPRFAVKVDNGEVFLDTSELASHAIEETRPVAGPARRASSSHAQPLRGSLPPEGEQPSLGQPGATAITSIVAAT
jgi:nitrite reductase (NADH) small subunit